MATTTKKTTAKKAATKKSDTTAAAKKTAAPKSAKVAKPVLSEQEKRMMIAVHAYYKWESAGCPTDQDFQHWIEAEAEVDQLLK